MKRNLGLGVDRANRAKGHVSVIASAIVLSSAILRTMPAVAEQGTGQRSAHQEALNRQIDISKAPYENPIYQEPVVLQWAQSVGLASFNYNTQGIKAYFERLKQMFSTAGWKHFLTLAWLSDHSPGSGASGAVTGELIGNPSIITQYPIDGRYTWRVKLPMQITYRGARGTKTEKTELNLYVMRVSTLVNPSGIAVHDIEFQPLIEG